jgi:hypothetical protein
MTRESELQLIIDNAQAELYDIQNAEKLKKNLQYIGKYYKYLNSYGSSSETEKWWIYAKVRGLSENGDPEFFTFQTDTNCKIDIEVEGWFSIDTWHEIQREEFIGEWNKLIENLNNYNL